MSLKPHTLSTLISSNVIRERISKLVDDIAVNHDSNDFVMIGILRGSFVFLADLVRALDSHNLHPRIDFITLESYYGGMDSTGSVEVKKDIEVDVNGADILLVDDILDTGRTLTHAISHIHGKGARTIQTCALLDKPARRVVDLQADYVGFTIEDTFVVGYGLDYDSYYRELPYIAQVQLTEG
ncbi:MAG: hypoxanthine phosphoribosyltransferase [Kiritimatiellia bacterium]